MTNDTTNTTTDPAENDADPGAGTEEERTTTKEVRAPLRTVIADDSVLLRDGVVRLLGDSGFEVLAAVGDADALLDAVTEHQPDLCIVDVRMPPTHTDEGLRAAIEIRRRDPSIAVLVLSQYVIRCGFQDLGNVQRALEERSITPASSGTEYICLGPLPLPEDQEREVLELMAEGLSNGAIAERLVVSAGAVEKHISNVFLKLGLQPEDGANRRVMAVLAFLRR